MHWQTFVEDKCARPRNATLVNQDKQEETQMASSKRQPSEQETYTLQGTAVQSGMSRRRAEKQAAFFLPYLQPGMQIVDCGCGPGSITIDLSQYVAPGSMVGIDIEQAQIDGATELAATQGVTNVQFKVGSVYELPFADASVDGVFSNAVIQHLRDPLVALREMSRILKPGGVIGVRTVDVDGHLAYPINEQIQRMREWVDKLQREQGHDNRIGKQLRRLVRAAEFDNIIATASYDTYSTNKDMQGIASAFANATRKGWYAEKIVAYGWADQAELESIAEQVRQWGDDPDAFYAEAACEVVGWRA